eukprot:Nitzschia sp. Nitz4//scaffold2_size372955//68504//69333//NITZ4_000377-RA/size372955-snap-gene-0.10-mRNA-1//1//CDS//3329546638//2867//frame0
MGMTFTAPSVLRYGFLILSVLITRTASFSPILPFVPARSIISETTSPTFLCAKHPRKKATKWIAHKRPKKSRPSDKNRTPHVYDWPTFVPPPDFVFEDTPELQAQLVAAASNYSHLEFELDSEFEPVEDNTLPERNATIAPYSREMFAMFRKDVNASIHAYAKDTERILLGQQARNTTLLGNVLSMSAALSVASEAEKEVAPPADDDETMLKAVEDYVANYATLDSAGGEVASPDEEDNTDDDTQS